MIIYYLILLLKAIGKILMKLKFLKRLPFPKLKEYHNIQSVLLSLCNFFYMMFFFFVTIYNMGSNLWNIMMMTVRKKYINLFSEKL